MKHLIAGGFKYGESNGELETNVDIRSQWGDLEVKECKRRRVFKKSI
jgi:hypothetical protein